MVLPPFLSRDIVFTLSGTLALFELGVSLKPTMACSPRPPMKQIQSIECGPFVITSVKSHILPSEGESRINSHVLPLTLSFVLGIDLLFLDAFSHLYKRVCPSVGRSVGRSHTS